MNPEGLERPRISRNGTLREFRARLNLEPTRFIIGKAIFPFCQGERDDDRIYGEQEVFIDRFLGQNENFYQYEEVNLSTITMNDVVLFADADIPFWIPLKITDKTVQFIPCAINKKIGEHKVFGIRRDPNASKYQFAKKPMDSIMEIDDDYYENWYEYADNMMEARGEELSAENPYYPFPHPEKREFEVFVYAHSYTFSVKKKMVLRNGETREIKVRKFTGTEEEMVLNTREGEETSHLVYRLNKWFENGETKERTLRGDIITVPNPI